MRVRYRMLIFAVFVLGFCAGLMVFGMHLFSMGPTTRELLMADIAAQEQARRSVPAPPKWYRTMWDDATPKAKKRYCAMWDDGDTDVHVYLVNQHKPKKGKPVTEEQAYGWLDAHC